MQVIGPATSVAIVPGVPTLVELDVFNDSSIIDGFAAEVIELEALLDNGEILEPQSGFSPAQVSIFPETSGGLGALLTLPHGYPAGRRRCSIVVRSVSRPDEVEQIPIDLDVAAAPAAKATAVPQTLTGGRSAILGLRLENTGNVPLEFAVTISDAENLLRGPPGTSPDDVAETEDGPASEPFLVEVGPRERAEVRLPVEGKRPLIGTPAVRIVTITADPGAVGIEPLVSIATFMQKPYLPRALLTIFTLLLVLLLWGVLLFAGIDRTTDEIADDNANLAAEKEADAQAAAADAAAASSMASGGRIAGIVVDGRGRPLGDVAVTVAGAGDGSATTPTDDAVGSFTIGGLPVVGSFTVTAERVGFETRTIAVELTEDVPALDGLQVVLDAVSGSISGTVSDAHGNPLPGVTVLARLPDGTSLQTTTASVGSVGFYAFDGLSVPGSFEVTFTRSGFTSQTETIVIDADTPAAPLDITMLPAGSGSITGSVSEDIVRATPCSASECPLPAVDVTVTSAQGAVIATAVSTGNRSGGFEIAGVAPGTYSIGFTKDGYESQALTTTVSAGATTVINAVMTGMPGSITGLATGCESIEIRTRDLGRLNPPRATQPAGTDGVYGFGEVPTRGEYRLLFYGPQNGDFRDIQIADVNLGPAENRSSVTATCSSSPPDDGTNPTVPMTVSGAAFAASLRRRPRR